MSFDVPQLISYYPKYEYLDEILTISGAKKLNIFVDLKGCIQSLYQEWAVKYIVDQSTGTRDVDNSLFGATLEYIKFHKTYALKRGIEINMIFFYERGESAYHSKVYKGYKGNRENTLTFLTLNEKEIFHNTLVKNYEMIEKICARAPNVSIIKLEFLEADFIPFYIRKHVFGNFEENEADVIYSIDKDMLQCLDNKHTFIFYRHYKSHKILNRDNAFSHWFKKEWNFPNIGLEWFPIFLSIDGDVSDDFDGVKGVSKGTILKIADDIVNLCGNDIFRVYNNIKDCKDIFIKDFGTNNKSLNKIRSEQEKIIRNLKLSSYSLISDYLNGGYPAPLIEKKKKLLENIKYKEKIKNGALVLAALKRAGITCNVSEQTIYDVFRE